MLLSLLISSAWPCAGLVHQDGALADSDAQEVIFTPGEGAVTVSYNVHYDGDAEDFGWIIPIFGEFSAIADGDPTRFDELRELTQPMVEYAETDDEGGGGCGCGETRSGKGGVDSAFSNGVEIVAEGFTGTYEYTVVTSGDPDEFLTWVSDHGWALHDTDIPVGEYAAEGGVQFVLIRLSAGAGHGATDAEGRMLPPVDLTYSGASLRFPAKMARYGMVDQVRTTVYVEGAERAKISSGWTETELGTITDESTYAEGVYDDRLIEIGGDSPGYGVVWAGESAGVWVTRFDTLANSAVHTVDPVFTVDGGTTPTETLLKLGAAPEEVSSAWFLVPMLGLGLGVVRRRQV